MAFFQKTKAQIIDSCFVSYDDRVEKYGHQIMRITKESPISKLKRMDSLQTDGALNWQIFSERNIEVKTTLPEKSV